MVSAPRQFAARFLHAQAHPGDFAENRLEPDPEFCALRPPDRRLAQELILGVLRWRATLDWLIARKTRSGTQPPGLQDLLRLGLYQLFWLDRVPAYAVVHDTVELARESGFGRQSGFVNAVLRTYVRERAATRAALTALQASDPATGWSHPAWLVERWRTGLDGDEAAFLRLLAWNNTPPGTFARVNQLRYQPIDLVERWRTEGVEFAARDCDWVGDSLVFELRSFPRLTSLATFNAGGFYIQDPSTLLAVHELEPQPGETILDVCAAPGGKTTFIAQRMQNRGRIIAHDPAAKRLELLRENCLRLGVTNVEAVTALPLDTTLFDRILVDAPCSNTGVLRRRVELRWRLEPTELPRLAAAQFEILRDAAARLKPGGVLVYSTCSLEPEENRGVIERFLSEVPGFTLERDRQLHPLTDAVDGAYVARLRRGS